MNKYDLGKQKTLAELCAKKDEEIEALSAEIEQWKSLYTEWRDLAEDYCDPRRAKCGHLINRGYICLVCGEDPTD